MASTHSIYETKAKLSELLRRVKSGREFVITERGKPIAKVIPFEEKEETPEERLARLEKEGVILPAKKKPSRLPLNIGQKRPGALKRFLEDRD